MRSTRLLLLGLLAAGVSSCGSSERAPSVLLISIDTLRADHMGAYGYGRDTSPRMDELAREGVLFEQHISSSSWTLPAHTSLFTGVSDLVHGCYETSNRALSPDFTTLAERFQEAGYPTGGFYAGPYLDKAFGLGQGFDVYEYCATEHTGALGSDAQEWAMDKDVMVGSHTGVTNPSVYGRAKQWMEARKGEPFFCFVHLWDVHFDFTPPEPYDTMFDPSYEGSINGEGFFFNPAIRSGRLSERDKQHLVALYDGEIRWTDEYVGKLLDDLTAWGIENDTIVVLTADHGTEFWEHGSIAHRTTLYDEQIHIPLILRYPGQLPAGMRVEAQSRMIDVASTVLQLADLPDLPDPMGLSLVALAQGEPEEERLALSELYSMQSLQSVRTPRSKVILDQGQVRTIFDLRADPRELRPLLQPDAGVIEGVEQALRELGEAVESRPGDPEEIPIDEAMRRVLMGLGYVDGDEGAEGGEDE